jgi:endonuclease I
MKNVKKLIALLIVILGGTFYVSETYLDIDLLAYIIPDTSEPIIDTTSIKSTITLDGLFDISGVTCDDNKDDTCTIEVIGSVNTSILGSQTITFQATDSAGNTAVEVITIEVIEGIITTMYVPLGYYNDAIGLTGESLKNTLNDIITNHIEFPYTNTNTDVWDMLREADEDPENSDNVLMFYSGFSWPKECQDTNTDLLPDYCFENDDREADYLEWNREHIWSKSHGEFDHEDSSSYAFGAHTDAHHLVAVERRMNSIKNNRFFDDCHDGINDDNLEDRGYGNYTCGEWFFEPRDEVKGDVARMLFYMAVRYEGEDGDYVDLELLEDNKLPYYGDLTILLRWHIEDPVDEWELERNEVIYQYQGNRNPFIDHPEYVALIWGTTDNPIEYTSINEE